MKLDKLKTNKGKFFDDVLIIKPDIFKDNRGFFCESWNKNIFNSKIRKIDFCQENHSFSKKNVLRGLHFQTKPNAQLKFVECISGTIFDVVVDLRKKSSTFLHWGGIKLSEENNTQILIPEGYAHGFYTLSDEAHLIYKVNNYWNKESERTIIWNDISLSINWRINNKPLLSKKDAIGKTIKNLPQSDFF